MLGDKSSEQSGEEGSTLCTQLGGGGRSICGWDPVGRVQGPQAALWLGEAESEG